MCLEIKAKSILGLLFHSVVKLFESKLPLLVRWQASGSETGGVEARKMTFLESEVTEKMAADLFS